MNQIKIAVVGITGRVGQNIAAIAPKDPEIFLAGGINSTNKDLSVLNKGDVIIDFSSPKALDSLLNFATQNKKGLVIGTTGYSDIEFKKINQASNLIPILYSSNFSLGIAIVKHLVEYVSLNLPDSFIDIFDFHHHRKEDAPSGTAKTLIQSMKSNKITSHSVRAANLLGEHQIIFTTNEEAIEIKHRVFTQEAYAHGAILAAKFIYNKPAKLYSINDLFLW
ncbi:MAG: 4-hydroxy-tetrahydrodipicolinate reductase [Chlamydiae bacterium]|nr:4-hydroxy-tetrahydrodipicolinate reductase [Chlamydiota bacterium]